MTSKHLYCKLFYEELKRKLWAVALLGLAMFFALPVSRGAPDPVLGGRSAGGVFFFLSPR